MFLFKVIPKSYSPTIDFIDEDVLLPQWAIVLIVIGVGSLCFIVIFGVTVVSIYLTTIPFLKIKTNE